MAFEATLPEATVNVTLDDHGGTFVICRENVTDAESLEVDGRENTTFGWALVTSARP